MSAKQLSIVVGEDEQLLRELIARWLVEAGHTVAQAANGREILKLFESGTFDLLVTDILMPDGDGWEAIAEVHRLKPKTRIIAMSGGSREIPASACLRVARGAGAIRVLQKPFSRLDMLAALPK